MTHEKTNIAKVKRKRAFSFLFFLLLSLSLSLSICNIFYSRVSMHFWHYTMCMRVCVYVCTCVNEYVGWEHTRTHVHLRFIAIYDYLYSTRYSIVSSSFSSFFIYLMLFNCFSLILHFNPRAAMCYLYLNNNDLTSECLLILSFRFFLPFVLHYAYPKIIYHINSLTLLIFSLPTK